MISELYQHYIDQEQKICTDTRKISPGCLFFALKGENFDGNSYAPEAIKKGAKIAVVDNPQFSGTNTILVENVLETLQKLANHHRKVAGFKVLALTGSNGKTTTKELLLSVLSKAFRCFATQGNLNNHIGVPITLLSVPASAELAIVEMGANHQGEIRDLCKIAEPDLGLITNIGRAHLEGFGGFEGVVKAKSELYSYLKQANNTIFVNGGDKLLMKLLEGYQNVHTYGLKASNCNILESSSTPYVSLLLSIGDKKFQLNSKLFGTYNANNLLCAVAVAHYFKITPDLITDALGKYTPTNNRSQITKTSHNTLIMDSYNANPSSMVVALKSFAQLDGKNKIVVLGEMNELGDESKPEHAKIVALCHDLNFTNHYFIGKGYSECNLKTGSFFSSTEEFKAYINSHSIKDSLIFIKGSRSNRLELLIGSL